MNAGDFMVDWFMPILLMAGLTVCFITLSVVLIMSFKEEKDNQ